MSIADFENYRGMKCFIIQGLLDCIDKIIIAICPKSTNQAGS